MKPTIHTRAAFSLVELSIVLVILGLLVGGILAGQSLIRASELRAVSTEFSRFITATHAFRDKYFGWPGDLGNATKFWGATASCPGTAGTGTQTCDGNGDGLILNGAASEYGEYFTYWQHLANAGLVEGTYTGIAGSASPSHATTTNVPRSKLSNGYWFAFNWNTTWSGIGSAFDGTYRDNMLQLGSQVASSSPGGYILKPEEAWNLDTKLDDGRPAYGRMRERYWDDCTDATSSANLSASYALNVATSVCTPIFTIK